MKGTSKTVLEVYCRNSKRVNTKRIFTFYPKDVSKQSDCTHFTRKIFHPVYPFRSTPLAKDRYFPPLVRGPQHLLFLWIFHTPYSLAVFSTPPFPTPPSTVCPLGGSSSGRVRQVRLRLFLSFHTCSTGISGPGGRICKLNGINEHSERILFVFRFLSGNFQIFGGSV